MSRLLKKGKGWRVGWHSEAAKYQGLIGSESWAIELTAREFQELYRLLRQLTDTMTQIATELMDEEKIAIEVESNLMWLEVEGYPDSYSLRLILHQERRCEGNWEAGVASELVLVMQRIIEENLVNC
ncbi:conserved hypothetical protein [Hyella patelloides LEGE 07179]|uniref:DUF1818 domain-containing protein n=1 Tax=Hyella patelloides LEGE 07179 TaxID=945734 RepID=A0A563VPI7_9CYAN|nr:DUF1818 family protein [Hyella patelloides]VEP13333.1 conserved hypothetical protein [Hyella patelloides LEGE 07179]